MFAVILDLTRWNRCVIWHTYNNKRYLSFQFYSLRNKYSMAVSPEITFQCNDVTYFFSESWTVVCKCPPDPIEYYIDVLQWRHNESDCGSNHRRHECLLNRLYMWRSKKTSKLHVNGLCEGNSLVTGQFPAQSASNAENISIWWRHHDHIRPWAWQTVYSSLTWTKSCSLCMAIYSI